MAPPPELFAGSYATRSASNDVRPWADLRVPASRPRDPDVRDNNGGRRAARVCACPQPRSRSCVSCGPFRWCRFLAKHRWQRYCKRAATSARELVLLKAGQANTSPAQAGYITPLLLSTPASGLSLQARNFYRPYALAYHMHCLVSVHLFPMQPLCM